MKKARKCTKKDKLRRREADVHAPQAMCKDIKIWAGFFIFWGGFQQEKMTAIA
jgi:hypothetical protein